MNVEEDPPPRGEKPRFIMHQSLREHIPTGITISTRLRAPGIDFSMPASIRTAPSGHAAAVAIRATPSAGKARCLRGEGHVSSIASGGRLPEARRRSGKSPPKSTAQGYRVGCNAPFREMLPAVPLPVQLLLVSAVAAENSAHWTSKLRHF